METGREQELKQIHKKLLVVNLIDAPGAILTGLGLYAVFGADGNAFTGLLNDRGIAYGAIILGGAIMLWAIIKTFALLQRKAELMNDPESDK